MPELIIALPKGRLQDAALARLACARVRVNGAALASRRLAIADETGRFRFIFVKPADVPVYVEHGIADCGVVGRDVLLESEADVLQPLDLQISRCRIVVAALTNASQDDHGMMHVATKYPRIAATHFGARGVTERKLCSGRSGTFAATIEYIKRDGRQRSQAPFKTL